MLEKSDIFELSSINSVDREAIVRSNSLNNPSKQLAEERCSFFIIYNTTPSHMNLSTQYKSIEDFSRHQGPAYRVTRLLKYPISAMTFHDLSFLLPQYYSLEMLPENALVQ